MAYSRQDSDRRIQAMTQSDLVIVAVANRFKGATRVILVAPRFDDATGLPCIPRRWQLPSAPFRMSESPADTARRIVREQCGIMTASRWVLEREARPIDDGRIVYPCIIRLAETQVLAFANEMKCGDFIAKMFVDGAWIPLLRNDPAQEHMRW